MPEELPLADIQQGLAEYRANFKEPITLLLEQTYQAKTIKAVHKALSPWNVSFENVFWNSTAKNIAEIQLNFNAPNMLTGVQLGVNGVTMTAFNVAWSTMKVTAGFFQAAADAIRQSCGEFQSQLVTIAFHLKPGKVPFKEVMSQFVNGKGLGAADANMYGVSVYNNDYSFVIDGSAIIAGGAFIKLIRNFAPDKRLEEMAGLLYKDEESVLRLLGLRLQ